MIGRDRRELSDVEVLELLLAKAEQELKDDRDNGTRAEHMRSYARYHAIKNELEAVRNGTTTLT